MLNSSQYTSFQTRETWSVIQMCNWMYLKEFVYNVIVHYYRVLHVSALCGPSSGRNIRGCADKSLARPGRKQATATKLGIYSTYSPRSSIHFLARCSTFCKPLKKNSEGCPSNQVSAADEKWRTFNFFFSPGNRW